MRRVVFDANVWISAFLRPGSVPDPAIDAAREETVRSVTSGALIEQVHRSLPKFGLPGHETIRIERQMQDVSLVVEPTFRLAVITAKESDNRVLECAVAGNADLIVTGDRKHLLPLGSYAGIPIISPRDFLDDQNVRELS